MRSLTNIIYKTRAINWENSRQKGYIIRESYIGFLPCQSRVIREGGGETRYSSRN